MWGRYNLTRSIHRRIRLAASLPLSFDIPKRENLIWSDSSQVMCGFSKRKEKKTLVTWFSIVFCFCTIKGICYQFEGYVRILILFNVFCSLWHPEMHWSFCWIPVQCVFFVHLKLPRSVSKRTCHQNFLCADGRCDYCPGKIWANYYNF